MTHKQAAAELDQYIVTHSYDGCAGLKWTWGPLCKIEYLQYCFQYETKEDIAMIILSGGEYKPFVYLPSKAGYAAARNWYKSLISIPKKMRKPPKPSDYSTPAKVTQACWQGAGTDKWWEA